jgi:PIN like domain
VTGVMRKPLLSIPSEVEGSAVFRSRLAELIKSDDTHVYVDTSFLMWLTKIGTASRQELIAWLKKNCPGRVHIPIWAAHEYLKHHVAGTIVTDLVEKTNEIADLVGRTYTYFRPFIDEAYGEGAEDPSTIRAATRAALNSLDRLAATSRQWQKSYQKHASEVIAFINEFTPQTTSLYSDLLEASQVGPGRFVGSVPPGFQDRRKKGSAPHTSEQDNAAPSDSNRYGDLVFWKELLTHARGVGAKSLVVLTNDRKNDWHLGRSDVVNIDPALLALKKAWKPVPRPHPMLVMEARIVAGVERLELLDSPYLAALLRDLAEDEVRAFADVAIIPDGPEPETENDRRARILEDRLATDAAQAAAQARQQGFLFPDQPEVSNTRATLSRALLESRAPIDERSGALLEGWRSSVEAKKSLADTLTADAFEGLDHKALVRLARELHDRVLLNVPGYEEAVADLVSVMDQLPPNTAASIYLGLVASMYLVRETNASRIPPSSPVAQMLFERQAADYAVHAVTALAKRLRDNDVRPLYVPSVDRPAIEMVLDTEPDTPAIDQLRSIRVGEVELLTPAQADTNLKLRALFQEQGPVAAKALVQKACELFALPEAQVESVEQFGASFSLTETIGFKRPSDISIPKEAALGD